MDSTKNVKISDLDLQEKLVNIARVTKVVEGGRTLSFRALVVIGDKKNGVVGFGIGKAKETKQAAQKGSNQARKSLIKVHVLRGTIPHEVAGKFKATKVLLKPAAPGTGIKAGGAMRDVLEMCGLENVLAKARGSTSAVNLVAATLDALTSLRDPLTVARQRGIPLEKVFNG